MMAGHNHFSKLLVWPMAAAGAAALLFSLYNLPLQQLGAPLFFLAVVTIHAGSYLSSSASRAKSSLRFVDPLILFAILLFGGEAAILLSAVAAFSVALHARKNYTDALQQSALTVFATFVAATVLRLAHVPTPLPAANAFNLALVAPLSLAIFAQSIFSSLANMFCEAENTQSTPVDCSKDFLRSLLNNLACAGLAYAFWKLSGAQGFNAFFVPACGFSLAGFVYQSFSTETVVLAQTATIENSNTPNSLRENSDRFRSAFDYSAIGMALVSLEGRWLQVNHSLCELLGYTESEMLETDFQYITHEDDLPNVISNIKDLMDGRLPTFQMEKRYLHKQGRDVWVLCSVSLVRDRTGQFSDLIFQIQDITNRKLAEQQLHHDAFHDALTGLPNRALFIDHLTLAIARSQRSADRKFAVLYLDVDRFKLINDSLGHMIGDQLLIEIARRLEICLRPGDTVARLGGDEFTILIEDIVDETDAVYVAERIQKEFTRPFNLSGREVFTSVSLGIAPGSTGYERAEDVLRDADTAMYRAKSLGKARHEIFDKAMHVRALNLLQLETDLRRAVERGEFLVHYQPIVALEDFNLRGFEALVRWQHPERGFISPIDFVPVAEESGLILQIGEWVLREACSQMQRWQKLFPSDPPLFISVNLSGKQFTQPDLTSKVAEILQETKVDPRSLKLEITESVVMDNIEAATAMLWQLRELGVQLSIDDFGTGYSSLSYLHRFPIDTLKIDRSFVTQMSANNENMEIVRTIIMLAENLGMDVVAEGVETNDQLALLRKLGCKKGQGYFFSRPISMSGAEKLIADTYLSTSPAPRINSGRSSKVIMVA